jgi:hypothetical protein
MTQDIPSTDNQSSPAITDDAISGAIGKLLEHPELISMVAKTLGGSAPSEATTQSSDEKPAASDMTEPPADVMASVLPVLSKLSNLGSAQNTHSSFKHEQLLCSLKPYLSKNRCDAIDYILRISKISGIIGQLR